MNRFSIKDIENLTSIKAHTIRIWEQRYGILQPKRTPTNIRYYDAADLKLALRISLLNSYGYKISKIQQMSEEDMNALILKINDQDFQTLSLTHELISAALALDTDAFESIMGQYARRHGMEQMVEQLIFRFLEKAGVLWMTDRLIPAQEHLASNIIFRKLAVAIEQLDQHKTVGNEAPVLLFLPEGEIHEIGLMYVYYLLRKAGKPAIYLGAHTPVEEARLVYELKSPAYAYLHLTTLASGLEGNRYFKKLSEAMPDATLFISGPVLQPGKFQQPSNVRFLYQLEEVKAAIAGI